MTSPYATAEYKRNRKIILEQSQYLCHYCNGPANTADHILPVSRGGGNELANLLSACVSCNSTRKNKTMVRLQYWNKRYGK
jgi:5-methylcytosine-specific restriction endonuclease McrA